MMQEASSVNGAAFMRSKGNGSAASGTCTRDATPPIEVADRHGLAQASGVDGANELAGLDRGSD